MQWFKNLKDGFIKSRQVKLIDSNYLSNKINVKVYYNKYTKMASIIFKEIRTGQIVHETSMYINTTDITDAVALVRSNVIYPFLRKYKTQSKY